ncbi:metal ABC transporter solute-binding protein, Zn/Mn family [Bythopirellula polymerisocia]|uniref:Periplasmic zinc-binding protein TroA n=1 Tax=Bythopirellula polymerisocia TaxID=2528003 RepID=A0A5C6CH07_9BACT|nr:zinc ABC transporter substrate-binding protein [Bythopirellula polymerisocia]TWU22844.1 Periplasmic zinc-binding protein TroA precursor [Bythopirellula polymerisocia]
MQRTPRPVVHYIFDCLRNLLVGFALIALSGCQDSVTQLSEGIQGQTFRGSYPIKIVCTTGQVAEMLTRIGGEYVKVDALMGPGVDPHLYRPIASDVGKLNDADAIFYNGLHLEGRMTEMFVQMARQKGTFAVTEGIVERNDSRLREPPEFAGHYDPHLWHDVALWADCTNDVAEMLAEFDPTHAEDYRANAAEYAAELRELDSYCRTEIAQIPADRRVLVTAHDAFGYFGKAYGLEVFGLKGISTEDEIDLAHQEEIQKMLVERKVPAVFVESAVAPRTVRALVEPCKAAGHDLKVPEEELYADALGPAGTEDSTYAGMIRHNVLTIVNALSP